jgi:hypothetical protein
MEQREMDYGRGDDTTDDVRRWVTTQAEKLASVRKPKPTPPPAPPPFPPAARHLDAVQVASTS